MTPGTVIARFSRLRIYAYETAVLGVCLAACVLAVLHPAGGTPKYAAVTDTGLMIWAFALTPLVLWTQWAILRQMIFHGGCAVWIEDGRLKFIGTYRNASFSRSQAVQDIRSLSIENNSLFPSALIVIQLKHGGKDYLPTLLLSEPAEVVRARLADALSLPKST